MIELRSITFRHPDGPAVLDDVTIHIEEGELLAVAGPTGSGKSTLLGVLTGLVPRFSGGELSGDLLLDGGSILRTPPRERAGVIGYVGQDPLAGFVTDTVEEELAYAMEQLGVAPDVMRRRVEETLDLLGIADLRDRALRTLSGGQQQRVAIGAVLTMHPRILVMDEPTSALDPTAAEDVLAALTRLVHDLGVSVVLAEHRLERVLPFADRLALLDGSGHVRIGGVAEVLSHTDSVPPIVELGRAMGWEPTPLSVRDARRKAASADLTPPPVEERVDAPIALTHRAKIRRGSFELDAQVELRAGEVTVLMGRNGAGKSTLLWELHGAASNVAFVPQEAGDLLYRESVAEELDREGASELLDQLSPGIPRDRHPRDLSLGQRLSLVLSVMLAAGAEVVLLDEPTRGLDYAAKRALGEQVHRLAAEGRAIMIATHDVEFAAHVADRVVVIADGEVVSEGPARRVLAESPAFAPQVVKVLGPGWLTVDEVRG
jgi:energy-coupling factor transport system ATP-binding protein